MTPIDIFFRDEFKRRSSALKKVLNRHLNLNGANCIGGVKTHSPAMDAYRQSYFKSDLISQIYYENLRNCSFAELSTERGSQLASGGYFQRTMTHICKFIKDGEQKGDKQLYLADLMTVRAALKHLGQKGNEKAIVKDLHIEIGSSLKEVCWANLKIKSSVPITGIEQARGFLYSSNLKSMLTTAVSINKDRLAERGSLWVSSSATDTEIKAEINTFAAGVGRCVTVGESAFQKVISYKYVSSCFIEETFALHIDNEFKEGRITEAIKELALAVSGAFARAVVGMGVDELRELLKLKHFYPIYKRKLEHIYHNLCEFLGLNPHAYYGIEGEINERAEGRWRYVTDLFCDFYARIEPFIGGDFDIAKAVAVENKHVILHSKDPVVLCLFATVAKTLEFDIDTTNKDQYESARRGCPLFVEQSDIINECYPIWPACTHRFMLFQQSLFYNEGVDKFFDDFGAAAAIAHSDVLVSDTVESTNGILKKMEERGDIDKFEMRLVVNPLS